MSEQSSGATPAVPGRSLDLLARDLIGGLADPPARPDGTLSDETLQDLMAAVIHAYARRVESRDTDVVLPPVRQQSPVTVTEVVVLVSELMKAADVEIFELSMWQAFGRV